MADNFSLLLWEGVYIFLLQLSKKPVHRQKHFEVVKKEHLRLSPPFRCITAHNGQVKKRTMADRKLSIAVTDYIVRTRFKTIAEYATFEFQFPPFEFDLRQ